MDDDTILMIGGLTLGGIFLYKTLGEPLNQTGQGIATATQGVGNTVAGVGATVTDSISDVASVTDVVKAAMDSITKTINTLPNPVYVVGDAAQNAGNAFNDWFGHFFLGKTDDPKSVSTTKSTGDYNLRYYPGSSMPNQPIPDVISKESYIQGAINLGMLGQSKAPTSTTATAFTSTPRNSGKSSSTTKQLSPVRSPTVIKLKSYKSNVTFKRSTR